MPSQKIRNIGMLSVAMAVFFLTLLTVSLATADDYEFNGEEVYNQALLGVESANGRWLLNWGLRKPDLLALDFTLSYCGKELPPTIDNLKTMVGRPCEGWVVMEGKKKSYRRLEFQCQ